MNRLIQLFIVLVFAFTIQSCTKENGVDTLDNLQAPELPSISNFNIPSHTFGLTDDKASSTRNDKSNWIHAGLNVLIWNTVVVTNASLPIAAFGQALDHEPVYIDNLTWEWSFIFQSPESHGGDKFDISLTGQYISNNEEVVWTMTVNDRLNDIEFVWYDGITSKNNIDGDFTFYKDPNNPKSYMNLTYTKTTANDLTIRFSNALSSDPGFGDYIEWRSISGAEYDREYDVFTNENLLEIRANSIIDNGAVKDPKHFNDNEWHCWGANKVSIDC